VEYILLNPQQFAQVNEAVLRTGKAQLEHQLEEVNDQAIKFARNAIDFFDLLDFPLIPLALPSNRYEKPIMMRGEAVGALGGEAVGALGSIIGREEAIGSIIGSIAGGINVWLSEKKLV
jgi:hypothetical protein